MNTTAKGMLKTLATRSVVATIPVAMVAAAFASNGVPTPPRLAEYAIQQVAEITVAPTTVGIAASPLYGQTKAQIDAQLDEMLAIGVTNIRVFVPWASIDFFGAFDPDTYPGTLAWQNIETVMQAAAERNMGVLAEVNSTPDSAKLDPNAGNFPVGSATPDPAKFAEFMKRFINNTVVVNGAPVSYGSIVSAYEIWNEPNYVGFSNPIDPEQYAKLVQAAYPAIKALDPTASVVIGAVGAGQDSALTVNTVTFVQRMLAALGPNAGQYFDALSIHPYGEEIKFGDTCPTCAPGILTPREQVEAIAAMQQLTGKKIWITEYGVPTTPGGTFTQAEQAQWDINLLNTWNAYADPTSSYYDPKMAALLGPIFLYTGRDTPGANGVDSPHDYYGLWDANGNIKLSGQALKDWIAAHTATGPTGPTDPTGPTNPGNAIAQFFQALAAQIGQAIAQLIGPQIVQAFVQAIANFLASLGAPAAPTPTPLALRVASVEPAATASLAADVPATAAAADEAKAADTSSSKVAEVAKSTVATDPTAAAPEATVTEPVVAAPVVAAPVVTAPVIATPVVAAPVVTTPEVTTPVVKVSDVTTPAATTPVVKAPETAPTAPTAPAATAPSAPASDAPSKGKDDAPAKSKDDAPAKPKDDAAGKGSKHDDGSKSDAGSADRSARHAKVKADSGVGSTEAKPKADKVTAGTGAESAPSQSAAAG